MQLTTRLARLLPSTRGPARCAPLTSATPSFFTNKRVVMGDGREASPAPSPDNNNPNNKIVVTLASPSAPTPQQQLSTRVAAETLKLLRETILPVNEAVFGPLERRGDDRPPLPVIFILGNHSSGKSTFINFIMKQRIQESGVAPTDDGFTIIAPSNVDQDQDGQSLVSDPDFGFARLNSFGPTLVNHLKLKLRKGVALTDAIVIDSPGMIDSPISSSSSSTPANKDMSRGYDFAGVVKVMAEKADVILLFFDPDRPGTTGETLTTLTNSLAGYDHKFLIVLNKVDLFERTTDFARSYGALCWNLSKVIHRKDLPKIYTMCTPLDTPYTAPGNLATSRRVADVTDKLGAGTREELDAAREEILSMIRSAPIRRIDNLITTLHDQCQLLKMHMEIVDDVRNDYRRARRNAALAAGGIGVGGVVFAGASLFVLGPEILSFAGTTLVSSLIAAYGMALYQKTLVDAKVKSYRDDHVLEGFFRKRYARELLIDRDESVNAVWRRVRPQLENVIALGMEKMPPVTSRQLRDVTRVIDSDVPRLRREVNAARK